MAYTQSTVSMQLSRLEASLGVALHEHEGRRIRFTAEGERLQVTCGTSVDLVERVHAGELDLALMTRPAFCRTDSRVTLAGREMRQSSSRVSPQEVQ